MSDSGLDLIVYLALTLGAGALSWVKNSREKKSKGTPPVVQLPGELLDEEDDDPIVVMQQPEIFSQEEVFQPVWHNEELSKKMEKEKEAGITGFGRTDEERYAMLERMQQESRKLHVKRAKPLFTEEEEESSDGQQNIANDNQFEFDVRQAIIANEILNRKY